MSETKSSPFVNLIRKSVGLPTGNSSCCGAPAAATESSGADTPAAKDNKGSGGGDCCSTGPVKEQSTGCCK